MSKLVLDSDFKELCINEGTTITVCGEVHGERIILNTSELVLIEGDTLYLGTSDAPAIGPAYHTCSGRWKINRDPFDVKINLKKLVTTTNVPGFSIGSLGLLTDLKYILIGNGDYSGVDGINSVFCYCPDARNDSTKYVKSPIYLDEAGYQQYLKDQENLMCKSDYPTEGSIMLGLTILINGSGKYFKLLDNITSLSDVGNIVGNISVFVNDMKKLSNDQYDKLADFLNELNKVEKSLWTEKCPKFTLCDRALICLKDRWLSTITDGKFDYFMNQLNLSEELHSIYYPGRPMLEYKACQSYMYGVPMWEETDNSFKGTMSFF